MRILHLYRPLLPGLRAQAIQVVHAAHALADRGHTVTLLADRGEGSTDPQAMLASFGLPHQPGFDLRVNPWRHHGLAGWWFRQEVARWWAGPPGVVLARDKRRLVQAVRKNAKVHRIVLETHELDSALAEEAGSDPAVARSLERAAGGIADALVANCGGTLAMWEEASAADGAPLPAARRACHNGTAASRRRDPVDKPERIVLYTGSLRAYKGLDTLLAAPLSLPLVLVGGTAEERAALPAAEPPVPYPAVPDRCAHAAVLVLPLADNLFGRRLTSPLKLWDYLATAVPIVAPDLPTIREIQAIARCPMHLYRAGEPADLARAVSEAAQAPPRQPFVRTWAERAAEIESLL